jgi:hypothetical protein
VRACFLVLALLVSGSARAAPIVEVYTMGPGNDLFTAFGHAAICVTDLAHPDAQCFNYGTADFSAHSFFWDFVRGRARFWVDTEGLQSMLGRYRRADRSVWRQTLPLSPEQAERLSAALLASTDERAKFYLYHHFRDNCTTRVRDAIDSAMGGGLRVDARPRGVSFRQWIRAGYAANWPMQMVTELILGRPADRDTDSWTVMFLPAELRAELATKLGAVPSPVHVRQAPIPTGPIEAGRVAFALFGLVFALMIGVGHAIGPRSGRAALAIAGLCLGLVALVLDALRILSTFPEFISNELLLCFWPSDLLLGLWTGTWLRRYLTVRLVVLAAIVLLHAGVLVQPLAPLALCALPLAAAWLSTSPGVLRPRP